MALNKELYDRLKPYSNNLKAAYYNSFTRMAAPDVNTVVDIYTEATGETVTAQKKSCGSCMLTILKRLNVEMEAYKKWYEHKYQKPLE